MFYIDYIVIPFIFIFILIPSIVICTELFLGQSSFRMFIPKDNIRGSCAILMPAHNEELIIENTLKLLMTQLNSEDRIIVIADNCTDKTADICRRLSVEVIERDNKSEIGKGYALDFGIKHLSKSKKIPNTIIVLDADCEFYGESLNNLVLQSQIKDCVIQSLYLMKSPNSAKVKTRVAEFAWLVKNKLRPTGLAKMRLGCHLQGSGMAFPWRLFNKVSFASGSIVEDLELGLKLAAINEAPTFFPYSVVTSYFPISNLGTESQRTRWEHGHLSSLPMLPRIMFNALVRKNFRLFFLALDAFIPPTILWIGIVILANFISVLLYFFELSSSFFLTLPVLIILLFSFTISWFFNGRHILKLKDFFGILDYVLSKFSLYKRFVSARQISWVRTDRDNKDE